MSLMLMFPRRINTRLCSSSKLYGASILELNVSWFMALQCHILKESEKRREEKKNKINPLHAEWPTLS